MAELLNRNERETELAQLIKSMSAKHARQLQKYLLTARKLSDIPKKFWDEVREDVKSNERVAAMLLLIFDETADQHVPGVDVSDLGKRYVSKRMAQIAPGFVKHSRNMVATSLRDFAQKFGRDVGGQIENARAFFQGTIERIFGERRAKTIADTEGNLSMINGASAAVRRARIDVARFWAHSKLRPPRHSNADEKPCPICSPMEGKIEWEWGNLRPGHCHVACDCFEQFVDRQGNIVGQPVGTSDSDTLERFRDRLPPDWIQPLRESFDPAENRDQSGRWSSATAPAGMKTYYRVQPAGLGADHTSETSNGRSNWLHVVETPAQVFGLDAGLSYGAENPEIIEIYAPGHRQNGDVEGVEINPKKAVVGRRWAPEDFAKAVYPSFADVDPGDFDLTAAESEYPLYFLAANAEKYFDLNDEAESAHRHIPLQESFNPSEQRASDGK